MQRIKKILALDPSGNYNEGKGTTGWCLFDVVKNTVEKTGAISAEDYISMERYWYQHLLLLDLFKNGDTIIVMEDYFLYNHKKDCQVNSRMETPKLIGAMQLHCWELGIPYDMQTAAEVKTRWTDKILEHKGYVALKGNRTYVNGVSINRHSKDAIRHAVHYSQFKLERGIKHGSDSERTDK